MSSEQQSASHVSALLEDSDALYAQWRKSLAEFRLVIEEYSVNGCGDVAHLVRTVAALHDSYGDCFNHAFAPRACGEATQAEDSAATRVDNEAMRHFSTLRRALHRLEPDTYDEYHPEREFSLDHSLLQIVSIQGWADDVAAAEDEDMDVARDTIDTQRARAVRQAQRACAALDCLVESFESRKPEHASEIEGEGESVDLLSEVSTSNVNPRLRVLIGAGSTGITPASTHDATPESARSADRQA